MMFHRERTAKGRGRPWPATHLLPFLVTVALGWSCAAPGAHAPDIGKAAAKSAANATPQEIPLGFAAIYLTKRVEITASNDESISQQSLQQTLRALITGEFQSGSLADYGAIKLVGFGTLMRVDGESFVVTGPNVLKAASEAYPDFPVAFALVRSGRSSEGGADDAEPPLAVVPISRVLAHSNVLESEEKTSLRPETTPSDNSFGRESGSRSVDPFLRGPEYDDPKLSKAFEANNLSLFQVWDVLDQSSALTGDENASFFEELYLTKPNESWGLPEDADSTVPTPALAAMQMGEFCRWFTRTLLEDDGEFFPPPAPRLERFAKEASFFGGDNENSVLRLKVILANLVDQVSEEVYQPDPQYAKDPLRQFAVLLNVIMNVAEDAEVRVPWEADLTEPAETDNTLPPTSMVFWRLGGFEDSNAQRSAVFTEAFGAEQSGFSILPVENFEPASINDYFLVRGWHDSFTQGGRTSVETRFKAVSPAPVQVILDNSDTNNLTLQIKATPRRDVEFSLKEPGLSVVELMEDLGLYVLDGEGTPTGVVGICVDLEKIADKTTRATYLLTDNANIGSRTKTFRLCTEAESFQRRLDVDPCFQRGTLGRSLERANPGSPLTTADYVDNGTRYNFEIFDGCSGR